MESLSKFGQQTPLVIGAGGVILKGNATFEAAKRLGWDKIAAIPFDRAGELVRGYKLVDNKSSELATWAQEVLRDELKKLTDEGEDIEKLGFDRFKDEEDLPGEVQFTEELLEAHNYIVLYFDNEIDFLQLQTLYPLKTVQALQSRPGFYKAGIGRVIRGADFLKAVLRQRA